MKRREKKFVQGNATHSQIDVKRNGRETRERMFDERHKIKCCSSESGNRNEGKNFGTALNNIHNKKCRKNAKKMVASLC